MERDRAEADWLALIPLLVELYALTLAVSLFLATMYVRFRDIGQIWEVGSQLLFYLTPIIYPLELLPGWAQTIVFLNPFTQIMQDARGIILYEDRRHRDRHVGRGVRRRRRTAVPAARDRCAAAPEPGRLQAR